jgi:DNA polymerase III epsilon subunit-like protein
MPPVRRRTLTEFEGTRRQTIVVDTETTGLGQNSRPPRPDAIVQVGYAWRNGKGKVVRWEETCNPGEPFLRAGRADEALRVNGLRLSEIRAARPVVAVAEELRERLAAIRRVTGVELELRSFNRAFDEPFLCVKPWSIPSELWGPCLMQAAQDHLGYWKWPKLNEAINMLGIEPPNGRGHTAAVDAHAALLIHERISAGPRPPPLRR